MVREPPLVVEHAPALQLQRGEPPLASLASSRSRVDIAAGARHRQRLAELQLLLEELRIVGGARVAERVLAGEPQQVAGPLPPVPQHAVGVVEPRGPLQGEAPLARLGLGEPVGVDCRRAVAEAPLDLGGIDANSRGRSKSEKQSSRRSTAGASRRPRRR